MATFQPGLSSLLRLDREGSPGAIVGDAVDAGISSFMQGRKSKNDMTNKAVATYIKKRNEGASPEEAELFVEKVFGQEFSFATPGETERFEADKALQAEERAQDKSLTESKIDLNKAKAEKERKKAEGETGFTEQPSLFDTREEAEKFIGKDKGTIKLFKDSQGNEKFGVESISKAPLTKQQKAFNQIKERLSGAKTQKEAAERLTQIGKGQKKKLSAEEILQKMTPEQRDEIQEFIANLEPSKDEALLGKVIQALQPGEQKKIGGVVFEKGEDGKFRIRE